MERCAPSPTHCERTSVTTPWKMTWARLTSSSNVGGMTVVPWRALAPIKAVRSRNGQGSFFIRGVRLAHKSSVTRSHDGFIIQLDRDHKVPRGRCPLRHLLRGRSPCNSQDLEWSGSQIRANWVAPTHWQQWRNAGGCSPNHRCSRASYRTHREVPKRD